MTRSISYHDYQSNPDYRAPGAYALFIPWVRTQRKADVVRVVGVWGDLEWEGWGLRGKTSVENCFFSELIQSFVYSIYPTLHVLLHSWTRNGIIC